MQVICPNCKGRPIVNPFEDMSDGVCIMCLGRGTVDTNFSCECGRPVSKLAGVMMVCSALMCTEKALARQNNKGASKLNILDGRDFHPANSADFNDYDASYEKIWAGMH